MLNSGLAHEARSIETRVLAGRFSGFFGTRECVRQVIRHLINAAHQVTHHDEVTRISPAHRSSQHAGGSKERAGFRRVDTVDGSVLLKFPCLSRDEAPRRPRGNSQCSNNEQRKAIVAKVAVGGSGERRRNEGVSDEKRHRFTVRRVNGRATATPVCVVETGHVVVYERAAMQELDRNRRGERRCETSPTARIGNRNAQPRTDARASWEHRVLDRLSQLRRCGGHLAREGLAEGRLNRSRTCVKEVVHSLSNVIVFDARFEQFVARVIFMHHSQHIAIIGGGIGGLAAAIRIAHGGGRVTIFEKEARLGGKMRTETVAGRAIDVGPTVLTMRGVFDELFASCGESLEQYVSLSPSSHIATHAWSNDARLDLVTDVEQNADAIGAFAGAKDALGYREFARYAQRIYDTVKGPFLDSQKPTMFSMLRDANRIGLASFAAIDSHRSMWRALGSFFADPRLRQLFGRYATYSGSSPFDAPATLNLISHVEREGVHTVDGGMIRLADGLEVLARKLGVTIRTECAVDEILITSGRARGVRLSSGETIEADAIVANADANAIASGLFGAKATHALQATSPRSRSLSALTWAIVGKSSGLPLAHHNVCFSDDYPREFRDILDRHTVPSDPSVYVCAQDRSAPRGHNGTAERFFVIVNAPAVGDSNTLSSKEMDLCESAMLRCLQRSGLTLTIEEAKRTSPVDFARMFPGTGGALYGQISQGPFSALSRPSARTKVERLYLASGSGHPGAGVPMVAISGQLAANLLMQDLASTSTYPRTGTSGSISTP